MESTFHACLELRRHALVCCYSYLMETHMATPVIPQMLSETSLSADFQRGIEQQLRSRLERAERLLNQAITDMRYWGNQIAIAHQSLARFEPQILR